MSVHTYLYSHACGALHYTCSMESMHISLVLFFLSLSLSSSHTVHCIICQTVFEQVEKKVSHRWCHVGFARNLSETCFHWKMEKHMNFNSNTSSQTLRIVFHAFLTKPLHVSHLIVISVWCKPYYHAMQSGSFVCLTPSIHLKSGHFMFFEIIQSSRSVIKCKMHVIGFSTIFSHKFLFVHISSDICVRSNNYNRIGRFFSPAFYGKNVEFSLVQHSKFN